MGVAGYASVVLLWLLASVSLAAEQAHFVGSESCRKCHEEAYAGWKETRMANVIRDPREHPEAVLGDFHSANPVRTLE